MRARMRIVGIGAAVAVLGCVSAAQGATVNVKPGPNALQNAIDDAKKGDTLNVKGGTFKEDVRVTKPLDIIGKPGDRPTISGGCDSDIVVDVQSKGVTLSNLKVKGATEDGGPGYTINFIGVPNGTASDLKVQQSCENSPQYGINLFDAGNIQIVGNRLYGGFRDAGIYVGGIDDTRGKTLLIEDNEADGNNRGIIIENSFSNDQTIVVRNNDVHDNDETPGITDQPTGIYVHNSDDGLYTGNTVNDNGFYGFDVDSESDNNEFSNNEATGNDENFNDEGTGNCGSGNTGFTLPGCM